MITLIRSLITSRFGALFALVFIGLMAVAFTLGDVTGSGSFGGLGGGNAAKVGKTNVTIGEFREALENRLKSERSQSPTLDMANFVEAGGFDSTLQQLINRYGLSIFGENTGIAVSKRLVDYEIRKIPGSKGIDGKFSQEALQRFLSEISLSEKTLREDFRQNFYAQQLLPATQSGPKVPSNLAMPYASLLLEKRSGQVAIIPSQLFLPKAPPSDAVLAKYYRDNSTKFTIPEKRSISYALFDKSIVDASAKPTPDDIAKYYKDNASKYAASQTRDITKIIIPTEAAAKAVADKIAAGQSISDVAESLGLSPTSTKNVTQQALAATSSKPVADAVFTAAKNSVAKPVKGSLGWFVVKVDDVKQVAAKTLSNVSSEIEATLRSKKRDEAIGELISEIEDEFADGATVTDVAKKQGLTIETTPKLLANGQNPENPNYKPIPEMQTLLPAGFQMDEDGDAQLIEIVPGERFALVAVTSKEVAAPPPLAKVRDLIIQSWAIEQGSTKAKTVAEQVRKSIDAGKSLKEALAALNITLPSPESISGSRGELRQQGKQLPPPLLLMFSMKKGTAKTLQAPNNSGWFIVNLAEINNGNAAGNVELLDATTRELGGLLQQEHAAQLVSAAIKQVGVKKNDSSLSALRTSLTTANDGK
jgi:peptidyl-prolyl cis-trans isomerase D